MKPSREAKDTFDLVPELYHEARPGYPEALLAEIEARAGLEGRARVLEVGPGTGKATTHFLDRGYRVLAVEPGEGLARFLEARCAGRGSLEVQVLPFEAFQSDRRFDLLLSAQAFHWVPPQQGLDRAGDLLRSGGWIALVWNIDASQQSDFYRQATPIHEEYLDSSEGTPGVALEAWAERYRRQLEGHPVFEDVELLGHRWEQRYTADEWIRLRGTFSPDLLLSEERRRAFHGELRALVESLGGVVRRSYRCVAVVARRR